MTSSNGNIFRVTGHLCGEQGPVTRSFDVFFDMCLNKRLNKQSWGWWFETPSRPLWCHCNEANCSSNDRQMTCPIESRSIEIMTRIAGGYTWCHLSPVTPYTVHRSLLTIVVVHWKQFSVQSVATISSRFWNEKVVNIWLGLGYPNEVSNYPWALLLRELTSD